MRKREETLEVPLSSLIDITFLLIIFFVVTAKMQTDVIDRQVDLAKSYFIPPLTDGPPPEAITINVREINGDMMIIVAGSRYTLAQVGQLLIMAKNRWGNSVPIVLRCDSQLPYREVQRINELVGKAGLYRVSHAAVDYGRD